MPYPASLDTFIGTAAQGTSLLTSPDHSQDHRTLGSAVGTIEQVLGTTLGTAVLKNFAAGDFAARINASNILQQPLTGTLGMSGGTISGQVSNTGTIANGVYGTALHQGGTANNMTMGSPSVTGGTTINAAFNGGTLGTPTLNVWNNWVAANETWTMLGTVGSNGTLQVTAVAGKYDVGDRIQFVQGGTTIYSYIIGTPSGTSLLVTGGTEFPYGLTAITLPFYSKAQSPAGFPQWYSYNSTWTGFSAAPSTPLLFSLQGRTVTLILDNTGTSNTGTLNFTLPVAVKQYANAADSYIYVAAKVLDNSTHPTTLGLLGIPYNDGAGTVVKVGIDLSKASGNAFAGFTTANIKGVFGVIQYPI